MEITAVDHTAFLLCLLINLSLRGSIFYFVDLRVRDFFLRIEIRVFLVCEEK